MTGLDGAPTAESAGRTACRHLFIVGRPIASDPSAGHFLRLALGQQRRTGGVAIFLLDDAYPGRTSGLTAAPVLADLIHAGARILVHADLHARVSGPGDGVAILRATDDDLADLLLAPGVAATWC